MAYKDQLLTTIGEIKSVEYGETHTTCQHKRKTVYAKDSTKIPHVIPCRRHAFYSINGMPLCKAHAGDILLNYHLTQEIGIG